jgi:hypothetical protein
MACGRGHQAGFVSYRAKVIDTVLGPIRLRRAWYHCGQCRRGAAPRDRELGVAGASLSPGLRAMAARAAAAVPFAKAAGLLSELAGIALTTKRIERSAEADGQAASAAICTQAEAICSCQVVPLPPPAPLPDMLYIAVDGTGVPMVAAATQGRPGKGPDGQAHTREVKLACCFTQTTLDDHGRPVRDPRSSSYLATFEPAARFAQLVAAEARRRGCEHIRQTVILGDGAVWIWNIADQHFPGAIQIVDLYHAREHLWDLARKLNPADEAAQKRWLMRKLDWLENGKIEKLAMALRKLADTEQNSELAKAIRLEAEYFDSNQHRMRYPEFRKKNLFVGSGVIEAGCKTVIGTRLKQSGMFWTVRGANAIIALRCCILNGQLEDYWAERRGA